MRYKAPPGFDEEINIKYVRIYLNYFINFIENNNNVEEIKRKSKELFGKELFEHKQPSEEWDCRDKYGN